MHRYKFYILLVLIFTIVSLSGCLEGIGQPDPRRYKFEKEFYETNKLRIDAGHPPLNYCEEKYKANKYWARQDPSCDEIVTELDGGEKVFTSREYELLHDVIEG